MNAGVPTTSPSCVSCAVSSTERAKPKSSKRTRGGSREPTFVASVRDSNHTLLGLMSRWIRLLAWAAASPSAMPRATRSASATGSFPSRAMQASRGSPFSNCIARNGAPLSSPTWKMGTMWSCSMLAAARASRLAQEPLLCARLGDKLREHDFEGDLAMKQGVFGQEDHPHPTRTERFQEPILTEATQLVGLLRRPEEIERLDGVVGSPALRAVVWSRRCDFRSMLPVPRRNEFLQTLEENDDVQEVYHNIVLP